MKNCTKTKLFFESRIGKVDKMHHQNNTFRKENLTNNFIQRKMNEKEAHYQRKK